MRYVSSLGGMVGELFGLVKEVEVRNGSSD